MRQYDSGNLYEYKDGGAEGYLIFGFVRMSTMDCKSGANMLTIDLSEMTDADAAYGIFAANLDPNSTHIADRDGRPDPGAKRHASPRANSTSRSSKFAADADADDSSTLRSLASRMEVRLPGRVTPPAQLRWFPPDNVAPIRMVPESVLGLRELKHGYVTKYQPARPSSSSRTRPNLHLSCSNLFTCTFPGRRPAPVGDEAWMVHAPYLGGICIFRKGRVLAGYVNLPTPQQAATLAAVLAGRIP